MCMSGTNTQEFYFILFSNKYFTVCVSYLSISMTKYSREIKLKEEGLVSSHVSGASIHGYLGPLVGVCSRIVHHCRHI